MELTFTQLEKFASWLDSLVRACYWDYNHETGDYSQETHEAIKKAATYINNLPEGEIKNWLVNKLDKVWE